MSTCRIGCLLMGLLLVTTGTATRAPAARPTPWNIAAAAGPGNQVGSRVSPSPSGCSDALLTRRRRRVHLEGISHKNPIGEGRMLLLGQQRQRTCSGLT